MSSTVPDTQALVAVAWPLVVALVLGWLVHAGLRRLGRRYRERLRQAVGLAS